MADEINSSDDLINSCDVIKRIEWIERALAATDEYDEDAETPEDVEDIDDLRDELAKLQELAEAGRSAYGWDSGVTLINADYFTEYAKDWAEDVNGIDTSEWPFNRIDWDEAADDLKIDYTEIEWDGETFYVR